jgi:hypothetical protein
VLAKGEEPDDKSKATVNQVNSSETLKQELDTLPDHLQDLMARSSAHLTAIQAEQVKQLLTEFQDVF